MNSWTYVRTFPYNRRWEFPSLSLLLSFFCHRYCRKKWRGSVDRAEEGKSKWIIIFMRPNAHTFSDLGSEWKGTSISIGPPICSCWPHSSPFTDDDKLSIHNDKYQRKAVCADSGNDQYLLSGSVRVSINHILAVCARLNPISHNNSQIRITD